MQKIKNIWTQVKLSGKQKQLGRWRQAVGGVTEAEEEDDDEEKEWREHKLRVRQDYRRERSRIRGREQELEERRLQERREMERWQRKERAKLRRALKEQEAEPKRPHPGAEPGPQRHPHRPNGEQAGAGFLSSIRPAWLRPGRSRVAPSEGRQLNWFNPLDGEEAAAPTLTLTVSLRLFSFHPITDDVIVVAIV